MFWGMGGRNLTAAAAALLWASTLQQKKRGKKRKKFAVLSKSLHSSHYGERWT